MIRLLLLGLTSAAIFSGCEDTSAGETPSSSSRDAALNLCRLNSDCAPGLYCGENARCAFDCREDRDCPVHGDECLSGQCLTPLPPDVSAARDAVLDAEIDTRPQDERVKDEGIEVDYECVHNIDCAPGVQCDLETHTCEPIEETHCGDTGCPEGQTCDHMTGECLEPPPHCNETGCNDGESCDQNSGVCVPQESGQLGAVCERSSDCVSNICLNVAINGQAHTVCAQLCCAESDCPLGSGCMYNNGVRVCLPSEIYPVGFDFTAQRGQPCGPTGNSCQSGMCDQARNRCQGSCCNDQDCGGLVCRWISTNGGGMTSTCDISVVASGRTGSPCRSEMDCASGICVPNGGGSGQCADLCCTDSECPAGTSCAQVTGPVRSGEQRSSQISTACLPFSPGESATQEACALDSDCESGHCVEQVCAEVCCVDQTCGMDQRCLPRTSLDHSVIRVCTTPN